MHGVVDVGDGLAVLQVRGGVGVQQQVAVLQRDGGESGEPADVVRLQAVQVVLLAAVEPPGGEEGGGAGGGLDRLVAVPGGAEEEQFVIAHQGAAVAACGGGLGGELHDQVDDADAVGAAVGEVAEEPDPGAAGRPVAVGVDQALVVQFGAQLFQVAVHVADDVDRAGRLAGAGGRVRVGRGGGVGQRRAEFDGRRVVAVGELEGRGGLVGQGRFVPGVVLVLVAALLLALVPGVFVVLVPALLPAFVPGVFPAVVAALPLGREGRGLVGGDPLGVHGVALAVGRPVLFEVAGAAVAAVGLGVVGLGVVRGAGVARGGLGFVIGAVGQHVEVRLVAGA